MEVEEVIGALHMNAINEEFNEQQLALAIAPDTPLVIQNLSIHNLKHDLNIWLG